MSPNNPTGAVATLETLQRLHDALPSAWIWVDAAYAEFAETDLTPLALQLPRCVVYRTLSKAWGLAGLRVGYAIGPAEAIDALRAVGGPYPCSTPSLQIAHQVLQDDTSMRATVQRVVTGRQRLTETLTELGASCVPSQANFVLARFGRPERAGWVADALASLGIAVRRFATPGLQDALRITVPPAAAAQETLDRALRTALSPEVLLFDVDGVLIDTASSYDAAILATAADFGVTITDDDISRRRAAGDANNDWILTQELLAERGVERPLDVVRDRFEAHMDAGLWKQERLLLAASQLPCDVPLAVVTGRPRRDLERSFARYGLDDRFVASVCMGESDAKPSPAPVRKVLETLGVQRAWMLGDTPDDILAARGAGVVALGIGAQPQDVDALQRSGAARVDPSALIALQETLSCRR